MGFISPVLLEGKRILQELCRNEAKWDDEIPDVLSARWKKWKSELQELENLKIERCFKPEHFGVVRKVEYSIYCIIFQMPVKTAMASVPIYDW